MRATVFYCSNAEWWAKTQTALWSLAPALASGIGVHIWHRTKK